MVGILLFRDIITEAVKTVKVDTGVKEAVIVEEN
jgi:hypothetical protein